MQNSPSVSIRSLNRISSVSQGSLDSIIQAKAHPSRRDDPEGFEKACGGFGRAGGVLRFVDVGLLSLRR